MQFSIWVLVHKSGRISQLFNGFFVVAGGRCRRHVSLRSFSLNNEGGAVFICLFSLLIRSLYDVNVASELGSGYVIVIFAPRLRRTFLYRWVYCRKLFLGAPVFCRDF